MRKQLSEWEREYSYLEYGKGKYRKGEEWKEGRKERKKEKKGRKGKERVGRIKRESKGV